MKLTRAHIEGYLEGRFGNPSDKKCPHIRTQSVNEWEAGWTRGLTLRHFHEGTRAKTDDIHKEVVRIRRARGERNVT